jgi:hypothetical protein
VLREVFGPEGDDVTWSGEDYIKSSFMIYTPQQGYSGDQEEKDWLGM